MFKRFVLAHRRFLDAIAAWLDYQQKEDYYENVRADHDNKMGLSIGLVFALAVTMGSCAGGTVFPPLWAVAVLSGICLLIGLASLLITVPIAIVWALTKMTVYLLIWVYLKLGYFDDRWLHKLAGMPYTPPVHKQRYARPMREWKSKMTDDEGKTLPAVFKDRG